MPMQPAAVAFAAARAVGSYVGRCPAPASSGRHVDLSLILVCKSHTTVLHVTLPLVWLQYVRLSRTCDLDTTAE